MTWFYPDISEWQPNARVREILDQSGGIICIRAGHGDHHDFKFDEWRDQLGDARLVMIYLYLDTEDGDGRHNADLFIDHLNHERRSNEVYVADIEPGGGNWTVSETRAFHNRVREVLGGPKLMTYANESYAKARRELFTDTHGWVARWGQPGNESTRPVVPHISWQHAADGYGKPRVHWAGCSKDADENRVEVSRDEFVRTLLGEVDEPDENEKEPTPPKKEPTPEPREEEDMTIHGMVPTGTDAAVSISINHGYAAIGLYGDNALLGLPPATLLLSVYDPIEGWYYKTIVIDTTDHQFVKPWFRFRNPEETEGVTIKRVGADASVHLPIGWHCDRL